MPKLTLKQIETKYQSKLLSSKNKYLKDKKRVQENAKQIIEKELLKIEKKYNLTVRKIEEEKKRSIKNLSLLSQWKEPKFIKKKVNWLKKCDDEWSKYIRSKWSTCYTCWWTQSLGCWHFISRKCWKLRRDERNTKIQCFRKCNAKFSGNWMPTQFEANLKRDWIDTDELKEIALQENKKPTEKELEEIYYAIKNRNGNEFIYFL